jgi:16S rRNA (guanine966-N2)-methyltransferase
MRIVGGRFRGRAIASPAHEGLRPTADRVRESVFNILLHAIAGFSLEDARAIDLFAGTGALGLEALSRGASYCLFVEEDAAARALIRGNVETMGLTGVTKIYRRDATSLGPSGTHRAFDIAFLDPPYGKGLAEASLASLRDGGWLTPAAVVVVEERASVTFAVPKGFEQLDARTYGDTQVVFLRVGPAA